VVPAPSTRAPDPEEVPVARTVLLLAAALLALPAAAQTYPSKPIRFVSAFAPGGTTDILARLLADKLREQVGQPVLVENRPGAGGNIGSDYVAKAAPDGYTLLMGASGPLAVNVSLFATMPFDPRRDFVPIVQITAAPLVLVVPAASPIRSVADLLAEARKPGARVNYGSAGPGSPQHVTAELFKHMAKVDMTHVPYKSAGQSIADLVGGQLSASFEAMIPALPHIKAGKLRALAVTGAERSPLLPDVPTVAEAGVPGFESTAWYGVVAPAGTPPEIAQRLNAEFARVLSQPDVKQRITELGGLQVSLTAESFGKLINAEIDKWAVVVKAAGIKVE
jgi:tripartite-type tricarboxylate transporter receptor subunit TctC